MLLCKKDKILLSIVLFVFIFIYAVNVNANMEEKGKAVPFSIITDFDMNSIYIDNYIQDSTGYDPLNFVEVAEFDLCDVDYPQVYSGMSDDCVGVIFSFSELDAPINFSVIMFDEDGNKMDIGAYGGGFDRDSAVFVKFESKCTYDFKYRPRSKQFNGKLKVYNVKG